MDFRFGPEEEAFREEIRAFCRAELPADWGRARLQRSRRLAEGAGRGRARASSGSCAAKGWLTLAWPKEHGGLGAGPMQQLIYNEEMSALRAPGFGGMGVAMVGPTLMLHGTDEQRSRFLGPIARGEMGWCQGFSEPGSGLGPCIAADARRAGRRRLHRQRAEDLDIRRAQRADYCILLARTDADAPKHKGISYFLMDMKSPGITITPLTNMLDSAAFNTLFLDNVRIPRANLVGELNRGWYVATTTLDFERSGIQRIVFAETLLDDLIAYAKEPRDGRRLIDSPITRHKLAELKIEFAVGRLLSYRIAWMQGQGLVPNSEASVGKLFSTELQSRFAVAALSMLGLGRRAGARISTHTGRRALLGVLSRGGVATQSPPGTSEVQRNIIAQRGLGMPRD